MKNILFIRLGGLGDLLVVLPSLLAFRKALPAARMTLLGRKEYGDLLVRAEVVDQNTAADRKDLAPLFDPDDSPDSRLSAWAGPFDLIVGWLQRRNPSLEEALRKFTGKPPVILVPGEDVEVSLSRAFFDLTSRFLQQKGMPVSLFTECLELPRSTSLKEEGEKIRRTIGIRISDRFAVVHPGSGSEKKRWPLERFMEIILWLSQNGLKGALVTGEAEDDLRLGLQRPKAPLPEGWSWIDSPPLAALAGLLTDAFLYIGNDSGVTHLAGACGTRIVALFLDVFSGPWKPNGRVTMLKAKEIATISTAQVKQAADRYLKRG